MLIILYKLIKKTPGMLAICSRRRFYLNTCFKTRNLILVDSKDYYENAATTPTQGNQLDHI